MEFLGLIVLVGLFFLAGVGIHWVLSPLDRAAKNRQFPAQFYLTDFLCLFVEAQLVLAGPRFMFQTAAFDARVLIATIPLMITVLVVWWTGVRTLSRAGIHRMVPRAFTLAVAIPFGFAGSIAMPILAILFFKSLMDPTPELPLRTVLLLSGIATGVLVVALGFVTRRIVRSSETERGVRNY